MSATRKRKWLRRLSWVLLFALSLTALKMLATEFFPDDEKTLRTTIRKKLEQCFPDAFAEYKDSTYGFFRPVEDEPWQQLSEGERTARRVVVLIHGLDDPGLVWRSLAPALQEEGYDALAFRYANDQPIHESACEFADSLADLRKRGTKEVIVIAHSMGGLVSREVLTHPNIDCLGRAEKEELPEFAALIMVGTPNHGSEFARMRMFAEARDHFVQLVEGRGAWLGAWIDGTGEAGLDIIPNSAFIVELNKRALPEELPVGIIAGVASPFKPDEIEARIARLRLALPNELSEKLAEIGDDLGEVADGVGDGLVSLESARLEGVPDHTTVKGTHLSMIRNITEGSDRVPPAVPVILDRLEQWNLSPAKPSD